MLHLEQLRSDIRALGERAVAQQRRQQDAYDQALARLAAAPDARRLRELIAHQQETGEEFALPATDVPLNQRLTQEPAPPPDITVVAVDGSQTMPDRHAAVLYYLIQVGGLVFRYDGSAPTPHREATLHFDDAELYDHQGQIIGHQVGMRRTAAELTYLAELAAEARTVGEPGPVVALTDGPLLWPYSGRTEEDHTLLPDHMAALNRLKDADAMPAGFVERPGGHPLLNLLSLVPLDEESSAGPEPAATHLDDQSLMARYLAPGERTAWLKRRSPMNRRHARHGHEIWFCYINTGAPDYPVIARVETPAWAAAREGWSAILHAVLVHQAVVLHGYPYALARAHELALVTQDDKAALDNLLQRRLMAAGLPVRPSEKARQKSYLGRRR